MKNNYTVPLLLLLLAWTRSSSSSKPAATKPIDPSKPIGIDRNWRVVQ